jgi:hypothetical protein
MASPWVKDQTVRLFQFWAPKQLLAGACVFPFPPSSRRNPESDSVMIRKRKPTGLNLVDRRNSPLGCLVFRRAFENMAIGRFYRENRFFSICAVRLVPVRVMV